MATTLDQPGPNDRQIKQSLHHSRPRKYQDWAKLGKVYQSSTYQDKIASRAIDGNLDTFSQTQISENSWYKVDLIADIEIHKISVANRLGSYATRNQLPPFTIEIYNNLGVKVGSQHFSGVRSEYVWEPVGLIGRLVKIVQGQKNYLHLSDVSIWGEQAHVL